MSFLGKRVRPSAPYVNTAFRPPAQKRRKNYPSSPALARRTAAKGELKFHDVIIDDAVIATGGVIVPTINIIPQGITEVQRIGRKCTIKSINWKYRLDIPEIDAQADAGNGDVVRIIVYLDKQTNGATAAVTDILETNDEHSFRNLANVGRFTILMDKMHVLLYGTLASDGAGLVSSAAVIREYSFYKKCDIPIEFNAAAGVLTEMRSNNIGVLLVARSGTSRLQSTFRLRFTDV